MAEAVPGPPRAVAAWSLLAILALVVGLCAGFEPRWETNDDVGMAMAAHGFGLATHGTPNLIYSNVLWGHLVRALPAPGMTGYALAALAALAFAGWAMVLALLRLRAGWPSALGAALLVVAPAVLAPQFTVTAGLLALAAVLAATVHDRGGAPRWLAAAVALGVAAFLVRFESFLLVTAVAAPLLPWRRLARDRALQLAVAVAAGLILAAAAIDRHAYAGAEWQPFLALETPRAQFTDFDVGDRMLAERPELVERHGFTRADIDLVGNYFFADPALASPARLEALLEEFGPSAAVGGAGAGRDALAATLHPRLLPLLACALAGFVLRPGARLAGAWGLFALAIFALGASGRPGVDVLRVYVAPLALLALWPLATSRDARPGVRVALGVVVFAAAAWQAWTVVPAAQAGRASSAAVRSELATLGPATIVAWGGAFPYTRAWPVLADPGALPLRLHALGTDTLAPYAVATAEEGAGTGVIARLTSPDGVRIVLFDRHLPLLASYCEDHLGGRLDTLAASPLRSVRILTLRCTRASTPVPAPEPPRR